MTYSCDNNLYYLRLVFQNVFACIALTSGEPVGVLEHYQGNIYIDLINDTTKTLIPYKKYPIFRL